MTSLYDFARRKPEVVTAAVFLWAPAILILALAIGDPDFLILALFLAALPYAGVLIWMAVAAWKSSDGIKRVFVVLGLVLFLAIAVSVDWGPPLEY